MTILLLSAVLSFQAVAAHAPPDSLSLDWAYQAAELNSPRARELALRRSASELRIERLETRFKPSGTLTGQAVYHTEVASIPLSIPGQQPPEVPHDQYRIGLGLNQLLYDGGSTAGQRALERAASDVESQEIAVALYGIRPQVEAAYFAVLLADAQSATLSILHQDLVARVSQAESLVRRGVATFANMDVLQAELNRIQQEQIVANHRRWAALDVLQELTGVGLPDTIGLAMPSPAPASVGARPEYQYFESFAGRIERTAELVDKSNRPVVQSFADLAFGRPPGLNLFEDRFLPFASFGVRMSWSVWDWNNADRDKEALVIQRQLLRVQRDLFDQGKRTEASRALRSINQYESMLLWDKETVILRGRIADEVGSRLANGVATATDYLIERNAEFRARLAERQHRILLLQAQVQYNTIMGAQR